MARYRDGMSAGEPTAEAAINAPPPPRRTTWQQLRRRWLSLGRHRPLRYWLLARGLPVFTVLAVLYVLDGALNGWRAAYEVMVLIRSPVGAEVPLPAWLLSIAGWLLMPALAGAIAGYVISTAVGERRTRPIAEAMSGEPDE